MTKRKAIKALSIQKDKLVNPEVLKDLLWINQTKSYVITVFGKDSQELILFSSFRSYADHLGAIQGIDVAQKRSDSAEKLKEVLDNFIETVKHKGVLVEKRGNYLSRLGDTMLTFVLGLSISIVFGAGVWYGSSRNLSISSSSQKTNNVADSNTRHNK